MFRTRLRFRKFAALFILLTGYLAWIVWSYVVLQKRYTEAYGAGMNLDYNINDDNSVDGNPALCNQECTRFRNLLSDWPRDKPKGAVYYLAKTERLFLLDNSLTTLYRNFLYKFDYPVIVFHEPDAFHNLRRLFRQHIDIQLFMQEVQFSIPKHLNASAVVFGIDCISPISYRHMCRFQSKQVYEQPILAGLDYVWRLDDDSSLPANINYDLFAFMQHHQLQYGYVKIHWDAYICTTGLWDAVRRFVKLKHIRSSFFNKWPEPQIYYNNFEISALSVWTSKRYQDYIRFIDMLGGIYYYRWGDAPIKSLAVTLFVPESATHMFNDITYVHGNFYKNATYSSF